MDRRNDATGALLKSYRYGYDLAGNRTSEQIDAVTTTWTPNALNQLVSQTNPARTFTYDANGAMKSNGAGQTYDWDAAGRLWKITYTSSGQTTEFVYDGLGRRVKIIEKSSAGAITSEKRFVWEGMEIVQERDGANALTRRYFPEGHIGATDYNGSNGYFYTRDHLGGVRDVIGPYTYTAQISYDPYGRRTVSGFAGFANDLGYTGHYHHGPSGLTLAPFRAYDANLARWLSRDPIEEEGGLNLYGYVLNNPIGLVDPLGLTPCDDFVDSLIGDWDKQPRWIPELDLGSTFLGKRSTTLPSGEGFKPNLVAGGQGGAVSRHIYGHAGAALAGGAWGGGASYFNQGIDYMQQFNRGRTSAEAAAEIAGDRAARRVADAMSSAYGKDSKCKNQSEKDDVKNSLRNKLKKLLCK